MRNIFLVVLCVSCFIYATPKPAEAAEVYDVVYSDVANHIGEGTEADWITRAVLYASDLYSVDPLLVAAVMEQESGFSTDAISSAGAIGLMQLMPGTADSIGVNPYNPLDNVIGGVAHLKTLLDRFASWGLYAVTDAIAAYNAGAQAIMDAAGVPNYSETRNYVIGVSNRYDRLLSMMG